MKTLKEIIREVQAVRPLSARQIERHLRAADIRPRGARQRPQQYSNHSVAALIQYLGYEEPERPSIRAATPLEMARRRGRVLSLPEIKAAARAMKKGGVK